MPQRAMSHRQTAVDPTEPSRAMAPNTGVTSDLSLTGSPCPTSRDRRAIVIGAGLAGASVCVQLARRGWHLHLIDTQSGPAMAASALPVGMLSPHVTRSPTPLSRLTGKGVPLARREIEALVPAGHGWQDCEVDNLGVDTGRWPAALVRPAALVAAWLAETRARTSLTCHWCCAATDLKPLSPGFGQTLWQAMDRDGRCVAEAPVVVIAAALGSLDLALATPSAGHQHPLPLRPVKGQLTLAALQGPPLASRPQRNQGVFVPCYEDTGLEPNWPTRIWAMGSTYERGVNTRNATDSGHQRNAESLSQIHPRAARQLAAQRAAGQLMGWADVRCASLDRVPLVGALPDLDAWAESLSASAAKRRHPPLREVPRIPGLYTLCALGSRGLSLAALCGQSLARQVEGEPDDLDPDLVHALDPARFAWRQKRRQMSAAS